MKRRMLYTAAIFIICGVLTAGCDSNSMAIEYALARYLNAAFNGRYDEAYKYISGKDKAVKSLEESLPEQQWKEGPLKRYLTGYVSYNVTEITITGDSAKAKVVITAPNYSLIQMDVPEFDVTKAPVEGDYGSEMVKLLKKTYGKDLPITTETKDINLIKEGMTWKIFLDWKGEKELEEKMAEEEKALLAEEMKRQEEIEQMEQMRLEQQRQKDIKLNEQKRIEAGVEGE